MECVFRESTGVGAAQARCGIASSARIPGWADSRPTDHPVRRQRPFPTSPGECSAIANFDRTGSISRTISPREAPARPTPLRSACGTEAVRLAFADSLRPNPRDRHCATQPARPKPAPDGTRRTAGAGPHLRGQPASWLRDEQAAAVDVTTSGRMLANRAADGASASVRHDRPPHEPPR